MLLILPRGFEPHTFKENCNLSTMSWIFSFLIHGPLDKPLIQLGCWGTNPAGRLYAPVWCQQSHWSRWGMLWWTRDAWKCLGSTMDPTLPIILAWQWMSAMVVTWGGTKTTEMSIFYRFDFCFVAVGGISEIKNQLQKILTEKHPKDGTSATKTWTLMTNLCCITLWNNPNIPVFNGYLHLCLLCSFTQTNHGLNMCFFWELRT